MTRLRLAGSLLGLTLLAGGVAGCSSHAAAAGAGAGAAYYMTRDGAAEGLASGSMDQVSRNADAVVQRMGISTAGAEFAQQTGDEREISGSINGEDVTISLEREDDGNTKVTVSTDDDDLAQRIVQDIVEYSAAPMAAPSPADTTM